MIDRIAWTSFALLGGVATGHALAAQDWTAAIVAALCGVLLGLSVASSRGMP